MSQPTAAARPPWASPAAFTAGGASSVPQPPAIRTLGLTKRFGRLTALGDLSIDVRRGEIFGFLGPNGAGKSTTIRILLGLLRPTAGAASVLGRDAVRDSVEIRRRTGYLPGGIALYDGLRGEELLDYLSDLQGAVPVRRTELCERMELSAATLRRRVRDYSRGMRQKIGVVQALQHDPELAVLDEPTEGLDPLMQHAFYRLLDDLKAAGRTIFFSSHVLSEVERVCDRVAIVRAGRLMTVADVGDLLRRRRRHVQLRLAPGSPSLELDGVSGLADVVRQGDLITCTIQGEVAPFLRAIVPAAIVDLTIEAARLEEAFLEFYADPEAGHRVGAR